MLDTDTNIVSSLVGATLGGYTIEALLGQGGMSNVFRAHQASLRRDVALKVLSPDQGRDPLTVRRFIEEARTLARLDHPNIVSVYDVGESNGIAYIAMRLVDGPTLSEAIPRGGLPLARVDVIARQIGAALDYVHSQGLIHRDVKAGNVMLERGDVVTLTDFGIAAGQRTVGRTDAPLEGTAEYVAPEVARGGAASVRSDVYSLGVLAFELVADQLPFSGTDARAVLRQHLTTPPPSLVRLRPALNAQIDRVIRTALSKEPSGRFASAGDFAKALHSAINDPETVAQVSKSAPSFTRRLPSSPPMATAKMPKPIVVTPLSSRAARLTFAIAWLALRVLFVVLLVGAMVGGAVYAIENVDFGRLARDFSMAPVVQPSNAPQATATPQLRGFDAAIGPADNPAPTLTPRPSASPTPGIPALQSVSAASPGETLKGYYDALLAKDFPRAYSYWSSSRRGSFSYQQDLVDAERSVASFSYVYDSDAPKNGQAIARVTRRNQLQSGEQTVTTTWTLVKENAGWRLDRTDEAAPKKASAPGRSKRQE